jgi:hypothetical protein
MHLWQQAGRAQGLSLVPAKLPILYHHRVGVRCGWRPVGSVQNLKDPRSGRHPKPRADFSFKGPRQKGRTSLLLWFSILTTLH